MNLISTINQSPAVRQFADKLINETPERNALNEDAFRLATEIVNLPDVDKFTHRSNFEDEKIWHFYLTDIPNRVQSIINRAFILNNNEGNLSKATILNNFLSMCAHEGKKFNNPFNLFTLSTKNYNRMLNGEF